MKMSPKVINGLKNQNKLHILDLKQLKGGQKIKFFVITFCCFMALKVLCHGTKYPLMLPLFYRLILTVPWHKKGFSDLVPGTRNESLGYFKNLVPVRGAQEIK